MFIISGIYRILLSSFFILILVSIPSDLLWDRNNYLYYAGNADNIIQTYGSKLELLFNDYIFLEINRLLSYFLTPDEVVTAFLISFLLIYYFLISKFSINFLTFTIGILLTVLITPLLHLEVVAIRQALATILVILSLVYLKDKRLILIVFILSSLIHSSFYLLTLLFFVDAFVLSNFDKKLKFFLNFIIILIISLSYLFVANYLGFRQAELYASYDGSVSGGTFLLVLFLYLYLYFSYGNVNFKYLYNFVLQGFLLFLIFYISANASVSARFLESIFPAFILLLVNKFRRIELGVIFFIILAYGYVWFNGGQYIIFEVSPMQVNHVLGTLL